MGAGGRPAVRFGYDTQASPTLFRHYAAVREHLGVKPYYRTDAGTIATRAAYAAALSMDQPVDIINATIGEPIAKEIEPPAFSTLGRLPEAKQSDLVRMPYITRK